MWKLAILVNHRVSSARNHMEQPQPLVLDPKLCTEILCKGYAISMFVSAFSLLPKLLRLQ